MKRKVLSLMVAAVVLVITLTACGGEKGSTGSGSGWDEDSIAKVLPYPEKGELDITFDDEDMFSATLEKVSEEYFEEYVDVLKGSGFTVDVEKDSTGFTAFNEEGYRVNVICWGESFSIDVDPPKGFAELRWPKSDIAKFMPVPKSTVGKIEWEASYGFVIYVGETTPDDYAAYVDECIDMGFTEDYQRGDEHFYADNKEGYHVSVTYEGNHTMFVRIDEPDEDLTEDEEVTTEETTEAEATTETKEKDKSGVNPDLKAFLDEYEAFMYDYIEFMDKYENSDDVFSMLDDYTKMMTKYAEFAKALEEYDEDEMSAADAAYYLEVTNRVNQKMLESL